MRIRLTDAERVAARAIEAGALSDLRAEWWKARGETESREVEDAMSARLTEIAGEPVDVDRVWGFFPRFADDRRRAEAHPSEVGTLGEVEDKRS